MENTARRYATLCSFRCTQLLAMHLGMPRAKPWSCRCRTTNGKIRRRKSSGIRVLESFHPAPLPLGMFYGLCKANG